MNNIELLKTLFTVVHILGAVIGAGGALYSDVIFFRSLADKKIDTKELSFLKTLSTFVWLGLILLIISGVGLFMLDPVKYMASTKFISKMSIVAILFINGLLFHAFHIPFIGRRARLREELFTNTPGLEGARLVLSGIVSITSWFFALILGSLRSVPFEVMDILGVYLLSLSIGAFSSLVVMGRFLAPHVRRNIIKISSLLLLLACVAFYA